MFCYTLHILKANSLHLVTEAIKSTRAIASINLLKYSDVQNRFNYILTRLHISTNFYLQSIFG